MGKTPSKKGNKKKSKMKTGPEAVAMKAKTPKPNPFETIWSRRKFDIIGKQRKGEQKRVGLARSLAIEKRKKTLLKEYEQSGKASVFVDKRIGEQNEALGEFDKAIIRSQRERRLKLNKKSKYTLSDGEEDDFGFPGLGPHSERDDFDNELLSDDDNYDGAEASEKKSTIFKQPNGNAIQNPGERDRIEGDENKQKSRKEVMEEVILKSKFFKAQKAQHKEENEQLMEDLDKSFTSLVHSQGLLSLTEPGKMNALKALVNKGIPKELAKKDELTVPQKVGTQEQPDSYDKLVKEMVLDMRARPSDRTKTPEEIAQEERERLERLEEERQKRMVANDDSNSSDEDNEDVEKPSAKKPRSISGDDLGDSFVLDDDRGTKKGWIDEILERDDADPENDDDGSSGDSESVEDDDNEERSDEDEDEDNDHDEKALSLKDWEQSDDDNLGTDLEDEEDNENECDDEPEIKPREHKKSNNIDAVEVRPGVRESLDGKEIKASAVDIPYLIEAPKSFEELYALLENCSNADVLVVINRIQASNAIKLAAENRKKMQVFYGILLQYFAVLANKKPLNFELLNLLVKPLMELSAEIPYFAAICARQRILRTRAQFCEEVRNPENGCWPSLKTLLLLRLWSMVYPCSDFRHVVITPALLLMCEYLMRCPILSGRDVAIGSFLCSMILKVVKQSRRFCPEAIMFLQTLLMAITDRKGVSNQESQFYRMELKALRPLLYMHDRIDDVSSLNFVMLMELPEDSSFFSSDNFRASVLLTTIETLRGFVDTYEGFNSFPEIFLPFSMLREVAGQENMPEALQDKFKDVAQLIEKKVDEHHMLRQPLQMRKKKPVPIKLVNPKFEENFVKGRDYDPDRERAERRKLRKLLKQEAKGAARELRKDNYFLFEVKERDKARLEEERAEKYGKALAFLQEQEHAAKSGQLGKGKRRKR
ncbi:nucleolar protein 14 isoform X1 [Tripterygium wilfordii]|uniref:Nucleolar protein 14 isoform X1 n=1 Tax=Tripterygium wilfordii TaxID=458696 RepID=A0A7J7DHB0_TRIWF|nr:nucleolar protein 14 isoform X2 [Tripterygium wilfordii]KAF5745765.1 nucleolar protein 14 isoform X1 [Tripterygium wilfordii]